MSRNKINEQPCPYNIGVKCDIGARDFDCSSCGWYPMEAYRRRMDLKQKGGALNGEQTEKQS